MPEPLNQSQNQSPNLLSLRPKKVDVLVEKHHLTFSAIAKLTIILVQTIFIILLGLNTKTVSEVTKLETQVKALEIQLTNKREVISSIENTIKKVERLRTLESQRPQLAARAKQVIELIPAQVILAQAVIKPASMDIVIETQTPIEAAFLINSYFSQGLASQITLNSANLSTTTGKFITNMEVTFK